MCAIQQQSRDTQNRIVILFDSRTIGVGSFKHPMSTDMACPTIGTIFSWVGPVTRRDGGEIKFETGRDSLEEIRCEAGQEKQ